MIAERRDGLLRMHRAEDGRPCRASGRHPYGIVCDRPEGEQYVVYALRGGELRELAAAPNAGSLGAALVTLHEESGDGGLHSLGSIGVRDAKKKKWIVLPWRARA